MSKIEEQKKKYIAHQIKIKRIYPKRTNKQKKNKQAGDTNYRL